ncbi:MAG TPA: DUF3800 domain-containing protein [Jiangellaceae bacterium]
MPAEGAPLVEIACDESGSEGEKLVGGNTEVFAHASVAIDLDSAQACVAELRRRIRSPAVEYKANHLLREKNRAALVWTLGPSGPIHRRARVFLVEKAYFLVRALFEHVAPGDYAETPSELAHGLCRDAPGLVGRADWHAFLEWSNKLLWSRNGDVPRPTTAAYYELLDRMRLSTVGHPPAGAVEVIWAGRDLIMAARQDRTARTSTLDPLLPALARAIKVWAADGRNVAIVHDEHSTITDSLITELAKAWPRLAGVRLVDSMHDPRVQVADFLAGVARRIAEDALTGNGDAELTALLRPYVDPASAWGDSSSWTALEPGDHAE